MHDVIRCSFSEDGVLEVKGRDAQTGLPRTVGISYEEIWRAIRN
jgi:actin-like ATPase involved in cell morphogenesis